MIAAAVYQRPTRFARFLAVYAVERLNRREQALAARPGLVRVEMGVLQALLQLRQQCPRLPQVERVKRSREPAGHPRQPTGLLSRV